MRFDWVLPDGRMYTRSDYMSVNTWVVIRVMFGVYLAGEVINKHQALQLLKDEDGDLQHWSSEDAAWKAVDDTIKARV